MLKDIVSGLSGILNKDAKDMISVYTNGNNVVGDLSPPIPIERAR